jgi:ABC-type nitrate/sulfonate/bicarbonate transport system ATPase subunit
MVPGAHAPSVGIVGLTKSFGDTRVLEDFTMEVAPHGVTVVLGPSGCGKTTLLRCISGLESTISGRFPGLGGAQTGMVFQEPRLLPWATVRENLSFVAQDGARTRKSNAGSTGIDELLNAVELGAYAEAYPPELSGGMAQRVALARAFVVSAQLLLLDEPFRALDIALRIRMYALFRRLWSRERPTTLLVTHNVEEAVLQGDRIVVLAGSPGRVAAAMTHPLAHEERNLDHPAVRDLQTEIYRLLLGAAASSGT